MKLNEWPRIVTDEELKYVTSWENSLSAEEKKEVSVSVWTSDYKTLLEIWYRDGREIRI